MISDKFDNKTEQLLAEFTEQREELKLMLEKIKPMKDKIDLLIPDNIDKRYSRLHEEKVKTITEFNKAELEMRKEILKSLKDEIELRRKLVRENMSGEEEQTIREMIEGTMKQMQVVKNEVATIENFDQVDIKLLAEASGSSK